MKVFEPAVRNMTYIWVFRINTREEIITMWTYLWVGDGYAGLQERVGILLGGVGLDSVTSEGRLLILVW